jgi:hypothetical protein
MRAGVLLVTQDDWWQSATDLTEAIRSGEPAFDRRFGQPFFAYLAEHPEAGPLFNAGMAAYSTGDLDHIINGYDFPNDGVMVDVGGGSSTRCPPATSTRSRTSSTTGTTTSASESWRTAAAR